METEPVDNISTIDNKKKNGRIIWADYARSFAIFLVVLNHSVEAAVPLSLESFTSVSVVDGIVAIVLFSIGRVGVPVFLFLTGYLLLDRAWNSESIVSFWKRKWIYLFIVTEGWIIIYNLYFIFGEHRRIPFSTWIKDLLFLKASDLPHIYYMPMILGMYLLLPLIGIALQKIDYKILAFPLGIYVVLQFIVPVVSLVTSAKEQALYPTMKYGFSGDVFGMYILLGYIIKKVASKKIPALINIPLMYGSFIGAVAIQMWCYTEKISYYLWYNNIFLLIYSFLIAFNFTKFRKLPAILHTIMEDIARKSFGIYLTHVLVIRMMYRVVSQHVNNIELQMCVYLLSAFFISWLVVTFISKIPYVGKKVFYM